MDFAPPRSEGASQPAYSDLSRGGTTAFGNMRLASYEPSENGSDITYDPIAANIIQRSASFSVAHPSIYQQLQQQQHQHQHALKGQTLLADHEHDRRASLQLHFDLGGLAAQHVQATALGRAAEQEHALQAQHSLQHLRAAQQQAGARQAQLSLRQQVLTPTFVQAGQFAGPAGVSRMMADHGAGAGVVMARSTSLPVMYAAQHGQHQPGVEFHSPALSVDTTGTFTGPPASLIEGYSRPSSAANSFFSTASKLPYGMGAAMSDAVPSPDPAAASSADMSFDLSTRAFDYSMASTASTAMTSLPSANTTLCELGPQAKFSPEQGYAMVLPASYEHAVATQGILRDEGHVVFGMGSGNALGLTGHGGLPLRLERLEPSSSGASARPAKLQTSRSKKTARAPAKEVVRHTAILPEEGSHYSIDALLAITRAAEADPSVFPCPFCDKSYEGKHARSIWRRHLQDKHAIPLSAQPRRTRWDSDVNRPKNAEERRQRMLESKRRWAQKRRKQKHLEAEAKAAEAAAAAAVAEAEKSKMDESIIEQMRAWYEHAKAQLLDVTTPGGWNHLADGANDAVEGAEYDGDDDDGEDSGEEEAGDASLSKEAASGSNQLLKAVTPGRPTLAEASGISPNSPFALPAWLDQQPPSLRAAALAAIQAQRALARSRKKTDDAGAAGGLSASKSATKRKASTGDVGAAVVGASGMSRTLSLPVAWDKDAHSTGLARAGSMVRAEGHWDPFVVPAVPTRASTGIVYEGPPVVHDLQAPQPMMGPGGPPVRLPSPMLPMLHPPMTAREATAPASGRQRSFGRSQSSQYHHVGGVDHSPTPAGRRAAAAAAGRGHPPLMSSSSLASSPVDGRSAIRPPMRDLMMNAHDPNLALRQSVFAPTSDDPRSVVSSSPTSLGAAIALGIPPASDPARRPSSGAAVPDNPFSLDKHKISPTQPGKGAGTSSRRPTLQGESPRAVLFNCPSLTSTTNESGMANLIPSPSFAMSRHLPPLPGLNERSLGAGEDPMMLGSSGPPPSRRTDEMAELGASNDIGTPMRLFAGAFGSATKTNNMVAEGSLPLATATPRSRRGRGREVSGLTTSLLGLGPSSALKSTTTVNASAMALLATPDRHTRPRGLSSVLRHLGAAAGTPSAGLLRFNMGAGESPHSALMSMSMTMGLGQTFASNPGGTHLSAGFVLGGTTSHHGVGVANLGASNGGAVGIVANAPAPMSTSKSWGALSSAMLDWPMAGGVELSPIRTKVAAPAPLGERRDGTNTLPRPFFASGGGHDGNGIVTQPGSPNGPSIASGPSSKLLHSSGSSTGSASESPLLRATSLVPASSSSASGLSALGTILTRPRGLSNLSLSRGVVGGGGGGGPSSSLSGSAALPPPALSASTSQGHGQGQGSTKRSWDAENDPGMLESRGESKRLRA